MAAGSEKFAWRQFPGVERRCSHCGRALRVADVARVHTRVNYASGYGVASTAFYCTEHPHEGYGR